MKLPRASRAKRAYRKLRQSSATGKTSIASVAAPAKYVVDSPTKSVTDKKTITVAGWLIPNPRHSLQGMRVIYGAATKDVTFGLKRPDVAQAFPDLSGARDSGFSAEISTAEDVLLVLEADFGTGFQQIYTIQVRYSPEKTVTELYNPNLAENYAEHQNLISNKKDYFYDDAATPAYKAHPDDPKLLAFYLPQFHPIAENDTVWGKGFTEWTNVTADTPRFVGHRQPLLPKDLGFYDLRYEETIKQQIDLARHHGIHGFCFYYYWFSGQRLLEQPLDSFLKHKEWDFNFAICWANENWTKRWDGRDGEVIVAQKYAAEDPLKFIKDVEPILTDPRYIQEDGKPVLIVFRPADLKDPAEYARVWREYFRTQHNKELQLVSILSFDDADPRSYGFDKALDFAPQSAFFKNDSFADKKYPYLNLEDKLIDINFSGSVADYRQIALNKKAHDYFKFPTYKCVTPSWDNDARKKGKGFVMHNESPDIYADWLDSILATETKKQKAPLVFINAWNEWAEGAMLEPSQHYGSAVLKRTAETLASYSKNKTNQALTKYDIVDPAKRKLAVIVHLYYPEKWQAIKARLDLLEKDSYGLFVTLNLKDANKVAMIEEYKSDATVYIVPNRGRDVLPFVHFARRIAAAGYLYVLKLHAKQSKHRDDGDAWFEEVITNLLPSKEVVQQITTQLSKGEASMIGPADHLVSLERHMGSNEPILSDILTSIYGAKRAADILKNRARYPYFGGTMFWASLAALQPLLDLFLLPEDFQAERGQIDGTTAHALERAFGVVAAIEGKPLQQASNNGVITAKLEHPSQKYKHAP